MTYNTLNRKDQQLYRSIYFVTVKVGNIKALDAMIGFKEPLGATALNIKVIAKCIKNDASL